MKSIWTIRVLFLALCVIGGYAISQLGIGFFEPLRGTSIPVGMIGAAIGFGFGGLLIAIDEMLKGFSLRAFSAASFGLFLGSMIALLVDHSGLFGWSDRGDEETRRLIRIALFLGFGYIGMVLAMRSNKEDFSLIIPYVRFSPQNRPDNLLLLDTSVVIDGRVIDLVESGFLEGIVVVPRFVLKELQRIADSNDPVKRSRGRRGLEMLNRIQRNAKNEVKIHEGDFPEEPEVDTKLVRLAKVLNAKLFTTDFNLGKIAELQSVPCVNLSALANTLKPVILPGESVHLKLVREGKDKGQGVGYLADGTMVVVNQGQPAIGQQVEVQVQSLLHTGAGVIVFANLQGAAPALPAPNADNPAHTHP